MAFLFKFDFKNGETTTLAQVIGQLEEVMKKESPAQKTAMKTLNQLLLDSKDAEKRIASN